MLRNEAPFVDVSHRERPSKGSLDLALAREQQHMPPARAAVRPRNSPDRISARPAARDGERQECFLPLSDAQIHAFQQYMERLGRSDAGATLELQRALGLRAIEAVRAGQMDTLLRWHRELTERGCVRVFDGTKGGRPREVHPADVKRALAAVQRAQEILEASGRRYLLARAKGVETTGLKQAAKVYSDLCSRAKLQSHAARYAFAEERMRAYRNEGYSQREARVQTSLDLGHGDGRGRYVASVYVRNG